jgi:hypothetical protein
MDKPVLAYDGSWVGCFPRLYSKSLTMSSPASRLAAERRCRLAAGIDNLANTEKNLEPLINNGRELADPLNYLHHSAAWLCDSSALR